MACDPRQLATLAGCFACSSVPQQLFQIQILCTINGACDPKDLQNNARCLASCSSQLQAMKVWILTQAVSMSADPQTLVNASACFLNCLTPVELEFVQTYLIAQEASPFPATPDSLAPVISCTELCEIPGMIDAVLVYLYANFAGVSYDVAFLSSQVACLACLPASVLKAIEVYLWCQLEQSVLPV
jgi:hypothetical protein